MHSENGRAGSAGAHEILRALRLLARRNAHAEPLHANGGAADGMSIIEQAGASRKRVARNVWGCLVDRGWAEPCGGEGLWQISALGREELSRRSREERKAAVPDPSRPDVVPPSATEPGRDFAESPVAWLARRKDKDGEPLISADQLAAAERLRSDFWFSGMSPRVTTNWMAALGGGRSQRSPSGAGVEIQDAVIAARVRVSRALAAVGPELAGLLIDVCCHLKGLETVERSFRWPQRTAKVILGIALNELARHYGIGEMARVVSRSARPDIRHWGASDYRPALDPGELSAGIGCGK